jgi:hypothetical protein
MNTQYYKNPPKSTSQLSSIIIQRVPLVRSPQSPHGWHPGAALPPKGINPDPYRALERHAEAAQNAAQDSAPATREMRRAA